MPRAMWSGTITFGLVNIPVRLLPATRRKDVRFHEIDRVTGRRVQHQRVVFSERWEWPPEDQAASTEVRPSPARELSGGSEVVASSEVVKGYEVAPGSYVAVTPEEIEELRPERTKTIDIQEFVPVEEVDPVHFDTAYQVVPQWDFERPFALLVEALTAADRLAIAWIVLRKRRHLAALRPYRGLLLLTTLHFADEVLEPARPAPTEAPGPRELRMAALLIEQMADHFDPGRYEDDYRRRLLDLIATRTAEAQPLDEPPDKVATDGVSDLMAALEASLIKSREARKSPPSQGAGRSG
jgi:DNA end-binding protein Ku